MNAAGARQDTPGIVAAMDSSSLPMPGLATTIVNPVSMTLDSQRSSFLGAAGGFFEFPVGSQNSP